MQGVGAALESGLHDTSAGAAELRVVVIVQYGDFFGSLRRRHETKTADIVPLRVGIGRAIEQKFVGEGTASGDRKIIHPPVVVRAVCDAPLGINVQYAGRVVSECV